MSLSLNLTRFSQRVIQPGFAVRASPIRNRALLFGATLSGAFYTYYVQATCESRRNKILDTLSEFAPHINTDALLKQVQALDGTDQEEHISLSAFKEIFQLGGIRDDELLENLFELMDWNETGFLRQGEVAAILTLFQTGDENARYEFLFRVFDMDGNSLVNKVEFRSILIALLDAKSHFHGPHRQPIPDEFFVDVEESEYHAVSKVLANQMVREIFFWADKTNDGDLTLKEFVQWCQRGGRNVEVATDLLRQALAE